MAAIKAGEKVQMSVLFSIDIFDLLDADVIMPWEDVVKTDEERAWIKSFYPALMANSMSGEQDVWHSLSALDYCDVLQQGRLP